MPTRAGLKTHKMATNVSRLLNPPPEATPPRPIAAALHTWGLLAAVLILSFTGSDRISAQATRPHGRLIMYVGTIVVDWVIVGYIWMGVKRRGMSLRELIGGRWERLEDFLLDTATAIGFWVSWSILVVVASFAIGHANLDPGKTMGRLHELKKTIGFIVPQGTLEMALFLALTLSAGFCEEVIYRGYFQRQFSAWSGNVTLAVVAQGVLFGASHGYQGWSSMLVIAVFGCAFGILAAWRKNLRPGMMAHAWQDLFTGIVLKIAMKLAP
ncbi:MAG: CPBP family intramembrane glutamic endopeptidase [Terriglobales bacterium]